MECPRFLFAKILIFFCMSCMKRKYACVSMADHGSAMQDHGCMQPWHACNLFCEGIVLFRVGTIKLFSTLKIFVADLQSNTGQFCKSQNYETKQGWTAGPVHTGCGGAHKCWMQKVEHIVAKWSVHTGLQATYIKGFACKSASVSCVNNLPRTMVSKSFSL